MTDTPPVLHWKRDAREYQRVKRRESHARETPERKEQRLAAMRVYRKTHADHTAKARNARYAYKAATGKRKRSAYTAEIKERARLWRAANPDKVKRHRARASAKRRQDSHERIFDNFSFSLRAILKNEKARRPWADILGYSRTTLIRHLERQFVPGMTWENFGAVWHIDHIVPKKHFRGDGWTLDSVIAAWQLSNLRPLFAIENFKKGSKRLHLL